MIIVAAVTRSDLKISLKIRLQFLATPISTATDSMTWKIFPDTMQVLKNYQCERFVNQIEIDRIVSNHLRSCDTHQFKIIANNRFRFLVAPIGLMLWL